jgi:hypothetical protein
MIRVPRMHAVALLMAITAIASPLDAHSISELWNSPSRLTAAEACEVLGREADGKIVAPTELFEAEKYVRTDSGVSLSLYVVTEVLTRFLVHRVHDWGGDVRLRSFPPVLQWLEAHSGSNRLRLRGESVQVAVLNAGANRAATVLYHQTILQDWGLCEGALCFTRVATEVVISSPRHPTISLRHRVGETAPGESNRVLCGFFARRSDASARFTYLVSDNFAAPPASASRSAVRNNPLDFTLFDPARP